MSNASDNLLTAENIEPCKFCGSLAIDDDGYCAECGMLRLGGETINIEPVALPSGVILAKLSIPDKADTTDGYRLIELPQGEYVVGRTDADIVVNDPYVSRLHANLCVVSDGVTVTDRGSTNGTFINGERSTANETVALKEGDSLRFGQTDVVWEFFGKGTHDFDDSTTLPNAEPQFASGYEHKSGSEVVDDTVSANAATDDTAPSTTLTYQSDAPESDESESSHNRSKWMLICVNRDLPEFTLSYGKSVIGRKVGKADIVVTGDGFISSAHICIEIDEEEEGVYVTDLSSTNGTFIENAQIEPLLAVKLDNGAHIRIGETEFELATIDRS